MSQHDFNIADQDMPPARADINAALVALATQSSGLTPPATTHPHQFWMDETANILKKRNRANDGWVNIMAFGPNGEVAMCGAPGTYLDGAYTTAPFGSLKCNGALILRADYPELFAKIGTTYGAGDGSTTFALPESRGDFRRYLDDGRGVDPGRAIGSFQDGTWTRQAMDDHEGADVPSNNADRFIGQAFAQADRFTNGQYVNPTDPRNGNNSVRNLTTTADNISLGGILGTHPGANTWIQYRVRNRAALACIRYI